MKWSQPKAIRIESTRQSEKLCQVEWGCTANRLNMDCFRNGLLTSSFPLDFPLGKGILKAMITGIVVEVAEA